MRLERQEQYDVLVIGAGIAGISAALAAAEQGRSVALASSTQIFSGSSFYPGTWGLGLIGPADDGDRRELADTIAEVGCGMADPALVEAFVDGIRPAIAGLRDMGVQLRRADRAGEREFIPCFDHKHRDWNGIVFDSARQVLSQRMEALGVVLRPGWEALELVQQEGRVCGAVMCAGGQLWYVGCRSLVLATGGYGGIFRYHLNTPDVAGVGQGLALKAGCTLVNMEFMQMMPGYIRPAAKTIFNEKTFRYTRLYRPDGSPLLPDTPHSQELLEIRSGHGPFTSRLPSREVDLAIFRAFQADQQGVTAVYTQELRREMPEFVRTYFDWLYASKGLTVDDPIQLGIFAHAANGGVRIGPDAATEVPGLFACGEVTGGMHGADRLGGLSTANGLVFGGKAGASAARASGEAPWGPEFWNFDTWATPDSGARLEELREIMFRNAMVLRTETGLTDALARVRAMAELPRSQTGSVEEAAGARRLAAQLDTAQAVLCAALHRRESRGAHYRADFPEMDMAQNRPIFVKLTEAGVTAGEKE